MFAAANLVREEWSPAEPVWSPPNASDVRRAWMKDKLRVEAASFRGRPVWFRVVPAWRQPEETRSRTFAEHASDWAWQGLQLLVIVTAALIARRNLRQDRDRKSTRLNSSHLGISYAVF